MIKNFKQTLPIFSLCSALMFFACVSSEPQKPLNKIMNFNEGITYLAQDINAQFEKDIMGNLSNFGQKQKLMIDSFLDANSGQALTINKAIDNILFQVLDKRFEVMRMGAGGSESHADFILSGILTFEQIGNTPKKAYHCYVSVYSKKDGIIKACSSAYINLPEYQPTATYQDSPLFLRNNQLENLSKSVVNRQPGEKISEEYLSYLDTKQYVVAAENDYEKEYYDKALRNYTLAEKQSDGKNLNVYSGLYNSARQLGQMNEAEKYFGMLVKTSMIENKRIEIKLLFKVNSPEFIDTAEMPKHYGMWLKQIAEQLKQNNICVRIQGHSSKTGEEAYNKALSKKRADMVQRVLAISYPEIIKHSETKGMGFSENIVGSGTDDARDAIDRRVEFVLMDCR